MRRFYLSYILIAIVYNCNAQSVTNNTISIASGQFSNGNIQLNFTIGETFATNRLAGIGTGFWSVVSTNYSPAATVIYRFTGDGNFSDAGNWERNVTPPNPLPRGTEILINPADSGQCIINAPYNVSPGAKFSVITGKKLIVNGNLTLTGP